MAFTLPALPEIGDKPVAIRVSAKAAKHVRKGHPWIFDGSVEHVGRDGPAGALAVVYGPKREQLALGLYDPHSPVRVRVLHAGGARAIDDAFFAERIAAAIARRASIGADTDGYRVVHGENDRLPALVVDRYADTLVVKLYSAAWLGRLGQVLGPVCEALAPARVVLRLARHVAKLPPALLGAVRDGLALAGGLPNGVGLFRENGLCFEVDPVRGQKTGFFLDQRDNRALVGASARGLEVLNAFSYTGGFSLYAARGGARRVVSLDLSGPALEACARNFGHNPGLAEVPHEAIQGDAFEALEQLAQAGRRFGMVVIDPPSFAKQASEIERALGSYARLCRLGLRVLTEGGELVMSSCSSRVDKDAFRETLIDAAARAGRPLAIHRETGHAVDHPIGFPEGAYLKCVYARA